MSSKRRAQPKKRSFSRTAAVGIVMIATVAIIVVAFMFFSRGQGFKEFKALVPSDDGLYAPSNPPEYAPPHYSDKDKADLLRRISD